MNSEPRPRPPARTVAGAMVGLEGLASAVTGLAVVGVALAGHPDSRGVAVAWGVLLVVYGAGILLVARGTFRGSRWARTPAYLIQFFALVIAWNQRHTLLAVAIGVAAVSVAAIVALSRAVREDA